MGYGATDIHSMGADFSTQRSGTDVGEGERSTTLNENGDLVCESAAFNVQTDYDQEAKHCGTSGDVVADLADVVTVPIGGPLAKFGCLVQSKMLTEISISYTNNDVPVLKLNSHGHANANHDGTERTFNVAGYFPALQGQGLTLPLFATTKEIAVANDTTIQEVEVVATLEHMDDQGPDGNHVQGENRTCKVTISLSGLGTKDDITWGADWTQEGESDEDSNTEADKFTASAHAYVAKN